MAERASHVSASGRYKVVKRDLDGEAVYVVIDQETGEEWPPDMPGVDELWEAKSWADRQDNKLPV